MQNPVIAAITAALSRETGGPASFYYYFFLYSQSQHPQNSAYPAVTRKICPEIYPTKTHGKKAAMTFFSSQTLLRAQQVNDHIELPLVNAILLPQLRKQLEVIDEFGFVVLDDDSIGPFYTSLPDDLEACHALLPARSKLAPPDPTDSEYAQPQQRTTCHRAGDIQCDQPTSVPACRISPSAGEQYRFMSAPAQANHRHGGLFQTPDKTPDSSASQGADAGEKPATSV